MAGNLSGKDSMHVPAILVELRTRALQAFADLAAQLLDQADDALFNLAQRSNGGSEQQDNLDAMRSLRKQRSELVQGFARSVGNALAMPPATPEAAPAALPAAGELSLIGVDDLEEQLARERLAEAVARRHAEPLLRFGAAFARIWEREQIDEEAIPLAPSRVARALGEALHPVQMPVSSRLVTFKLFERLLLADYGRLVGELNQFLHARGIAEAAAPAGGLRRAPRGLPGGGRGVGGGPAQDDWRSRDALPGHPQDGEPSTDGQAPHAAAEAWLSAMSEIFANYFSAAGGEGGAPGGGAGAAGAPRPGLPGAAPDPSEGLLPGAEVEAILRRFQQQLPRSLLRAATQRSIALGEQLKVELLVEAQRGGGPTRRLHPADEQALTLVGMLFDVLFDQSHFSEQLRGMLAKLLPAYAQVALHDPQLFAQRSHPARRLLNALTEAGDGNQGESPTERDALLRITAVVERVLREYAGDTHLFVDLEERFSRVVEQQKRRAALAERRTAESQRGRERLEDARTTASLEVAALAGGRHPPPPIDDFLRRDWAHHLTVTLLRAGEDSEDYAKARGIGVSLWLAVAGCADGKPVPESLREGLETVDASTGRHRTDEVIAALESLRPVPRTRAAPAAAAGATSAATRATPPTAAEAPEPAQPVAPAAAVETPELPTAASSADIGFQVVEKVGAKPELPTGDIELSIDPTQVQAGDLAKARALKQGAWVDLVDARGESQPAKLSWISPISQRMLFVNRVGARLCLLSPPECAALITQHKLVPRVAEEAFDRAMVGLLDRIREERAAEAQPPASR